MVCGAGGIGGEGVGLGFRGRYSCFVSICEPFVGVCLEQEGLEIRGRG